MKKQDLLIVAVLFALLMAWPFLYKRWFEPAAEPGVAPSAYDRQPETNAISSPFRPSAPVPPQEEKSLSQIPEQVVTIVNDGLTIAISSRGGGIVSARFDDYREAVEKNSAALMFDFSRMPSMTYKGLSGFSATDSFKVISLRPETVVIESGNANGLRLTRTIELDERYQVIVCDLFTNTGDQAQAIPKHAIQLGPMQIPELEYRMSGMVYLGIDALASSGGEGVIHWGGKLAKLFKTFKEEGEMPFLPRDIAKDENIPIDWVAVNNKFFAQIIVPDGGAAGYGLMAERVTVEGEDINPALKPRSAEIKGVAAAVFMAGKTVNRGEAFSQTFKLYIGPKKYSILRTLGLHQEDVMEFGMWSPVCKFLLIVLNKTYDFIIPNYGVAIILLTILIRIIFWPLTHKSTESMKKMQELQPLMTEIRAKHKDNPRKMQEETMALYRKHKVNPMSGCLPMLVQIPVFIALFVVLRSAIELRFAPFLWVRDLSAPEGLFADILPIPLNILPIFMAASQAWQQSLMPAPDPNQQKIMLFFMPAVMLVFFYTMPSALVLYWSANQCIVIVQQLITKKRTAWAASERK